MINLYAIYYIRKNYFVNNDLVWIKTVYSRQSLLRRLTQLYCYNNNSFDMFVNDWTLSSNRYYNHCKLLCEIIGNKVTVIRPEVFLNEMKEYIKDFSRSYERKIKSLRYMYKKTTTYIFHYDPVPNIHKRHHCSYYRHPKLHNVVKCNSLDSEYKEFNSSKYFYKNLPCWDDRPRHCDRSWKTSYKVKAQYLKHKDNHKDTVVIRGDYM